MGIDALLIPAILFFILGVIAKFVDSDLKFPDGMSKGISIYLLMAIGLKGGAELGKADLGIAVQSIFWAIVLGFVLPIIGYWILRFRNKIDSMNAAAISAHYGSVSAGTFLTAIAFLEASKIEFETYPIIMMVMMESPAIIIGLVLAALARKRLQASGEMKTQQAPETEWGPLLKEAFTNGSVLVLLGAMFIGAVVPPENMATLYPFTKEIFMGVLCLFLLEMGIVAAQRLDAFKKGGGAYLIAFGIIMPIIGGTIGVVVAVSFLGFTAGGALLVAILSASASYIAVPPVMRYGVPEANPSYYLALSLGVTFPFNVVIGIPLFYNMAIYYQGLVA